VNLQSLLMDYMTCANWAVDEHRLNAAIELARRTLTAGGSELIRLLETHAAAAPATETAPQLVVEGDTAILPVTGLITKYGRMVNNGRPKGTGLDTLSGLLDLSMADDAVRRIVLHIESPGGSVAGLADFADQVFAASFDKPILAFADDLAASAAYWIGSQANVFYASQSAMVGSIGVYTVVSDMTGLMDKLGLKYHLVRTGANKGVGYPGTPVSEDNLTAIQELVDDDFSMFLSHILRGRSARGMTDATLRPLADGRLYSAQKAKRAGLIDGVMTLAAALGKRPRVRTETRPISAFAAVDEFDDPSEILRKENTMAEHNNTPDTTPPTPAVDAAGTAAETERARILGIQSALADAVFAELRAKAIAEGWDLTQAKAAAFDVAVAARAADAEADGQKQAELQQRLDAIANSGHAGELDPTAESTPVQPLAGSAAGSAEAYQSAVDALIAAGSKPSAAHRAVAVKRPADHKAWLAAAQRK